MSDIMDTDLLEIEPVAKKLVKDTEAYVPNLGNRLRLAREAKKMSVAEVSERLFFTPSRVTYLENDEFQRFPAVIYVKGYVRSYAKLLGLPVDEIMAELDKYSLEREVVHRHPELVVNYQTSTNDKSFRWLSFGIVSVIVVLLFLWWHNMRSDQLPHSAEIPLKSVQAPHTEILANPEIPSETAMPVIEGSLDDQT